MVKEHRRTTRRKNTSRRGPIKTSMKRRPRIEFRPNNVSTLRSQLRRLGANANNNNNGGYMKSKVRLVIRKTLDYLNKVIELYRELNIGEDTIEVLEDRRRQLQVRREYIKTHASAADLMKALEDVVEVRDLIGDDDEKQAEVKDEMDDLAELLTKTKIGGNNNMKEDLDDALDNLLGAFGKMGI